MLGFQDTVVFLLSVNVLVGLGLACLLAWIASEIHKHDINFTTRMWEMTKGFIETTKAIQRFAGTMQIPLLCIVLPASSVSSRSHRHLSRTRPTSRAGI